MVFLILTTVIVLSFFVFTFVKALLAKFNNYLFTLIIEVIGAFIDFVFIIANQEPSVPVYFIIYLFGVVIPLVIFLLEGKNVYINYILREKFTKPENRQDFYFSIIERDNNNYWAHSRLAKYYGENHELEKQEIEYLKLIELNKTNKENYCKLAEIQVELKKPNQAIATLSSLLNEDPGYLEGNLQLAQILYDTEKFKEAVMVLNHAIEFNPTAYDLYFYLGMNYTRLNDFQNAKDCYQKAATLNGLTGISNLNLGEISIIFKDYETAEKYFMDCLNDDDDRTVAYAYYYLAKTKIFQKNYQLAIHYANLAVEIDPKMKKKIEEDTHFSPILGNLNIRLKDAKDKEVNTKMTKQQEEVINILERNADLVEDLTNEYYFTKADYDAYEEMQTEQAKEQANTQKRNRDYDDRTKGGF